MMYEAQRCIKIGLLTVFDPRNRLTWASWAEGVCHMMDALEQQGGQVIYLSASTTATGEQRASQRNTMFSTVFKRVQKLLKKFLFLRKYFIYTYRLTISKNYAHTASRLLAQEQFDVVLAPASSSEVVFLETDVPIVLVEDATFAALHNYYPQYTNLPKSIIRDMDALAGGAIEKAALLIYASSWAAQSAIEDYHADAQKVHVVPLGANLDTIPERITALAHRRSQRCTLLFLGVDWERKGGPIAFETLQALEDLGVQAELIVCGCIPPKAFTHPHMRVIPFLNKRDPVQRRELEQLYITSDFLLLPTRSECYGLVFCEANAYGLPVIATRTGGVPEVVRDGENGFLLPIDARGKEYAEMIATLYRDEQRYQNLVRTSRAAFDERLNWDAWGAKVSKLIEELVAHKKIHASEAPVDAVLLSTERRT